MNTTTSEIPKAATAVSGTTLKPIEFFVGAIQKSVPVPPKEGDWTEYLHAQIHHGNGKGG